jgi:Phage tail protein
VLTSVYAEGIQNNLTLNIGEPTDAIQVLDIDGLGPIKAAIVSSQYATAPGEALLGATLGKRNILFKLGLSPDWATQTMAELRQRLYSCFLPSYPVTLTFSSTHLPSDVRIEGVVEDLIPDIFSKDPAITVSIICGRPDFVSVEETVVNGIVATAVGYSAIDAMLTDIEYEGTAKTGGLLKVESSVANVSYSDYLYVYFVSGGIYDDGSLKINGKSFRLSDVDTIDATYRLEVNSVPGQKSARKVKVSDQTYTSLLKYVSNDTSFIPDWPVLEPGHNRFGVRGTEAGQTWSLSYFARYGGL